MALGLTDESDDFFQQYLGEDTGERIRNIETQGTLQGIIVTSNPNGVVTASALTFALNVTIPALYVNTNGATAWTQIF